MVYLNNYSAQQTFRVHATGLEGDTETYDLTITSTVDKDAVFEGQGLVNQDMTHTYVSVPVTLPVGLKNGEYAYTLRASDGRTVSSGLVIIGAYTRVQTNSVYQSNNKITFKQYGE